VVLLNDGLFHLEHEFGCGPDPVIEDLGSRPHTSSPKTGWRIIHQAIVDLAGSRRLNATMEQILAEMRLLFLASADASFLAEWAERNQEVCELLEHGPGPRPRQR
jgi:hypothetical protein